jgi:Leucine-rich repeat (LRR) protein
MNLKNLKLLMIEENNLSSLPPEVGSLFPTDIDFRKLSLLSNLEKLSVRGNRDLKFPPPAVCNAGTKKILAFLEEFVQGPK